MSMRPRRPLAVPAAQSPAPGSRRSTRAVAGPIVTRSPTAMAPLPAVKSTKASVWLSKQVLRRKTLRSCVVSSPLDAVVGLVDRDAGVPAGAAVAVADVVLDGVEITLHRADAVAPAAVHETIAHCHVVVALPLDPVAGAVADREAVDLDVMPGDDDRRIGLYVQEGAVAGLRPQHHRRLGGPRGGERDRLGPGAVTDDQRVPGVEQGHRPAERPPRRCGRAVAAVVAVLADVEGAGPDARGVGHVDAVAKVFEAAVREGLGRGGEAAVAGEDAAPGQRCRRGRFDRTGGTPVLAEARNGGIVDVATVVDRRAHRREVDPAGMDLCRLREGDGEPPRRCTRRRRDAPGRQPVAAGIVDRGDDLARDRPLRRCGPVPPDRVDLARFGETEAVGEGIRVAFVPLVLMERPRRGGRIEEARHHAALIDRPRRSQRPEG